MSRAPFMPLYVSDYLGDTSDLSTEQHGAYLLILMAMWNAGGSLPDDDARLARCARLSPTKWAKMAPIIREFFEAGDGVIWHPKLSRHLTKAQENAKILRDKGSRGGRAKALKDKQSRLAGATAQPKQTQILIEDTNVSSSPLSPPQPELQEKAPSQRPSKGSRLPSDWTPSQAFYDAARAIGLGDQETRDEADKFRDFWISKTGSGATKLDWLATWRLWCRRAVETRRSRTAGRSAGGGHGQPPKSIAAAAMQRYADDPGPGPDWRTGSIDAACAAGADGPSLRVIDGGAGIPDRDRSSGWR